MLGAGSGRAHILARLGPEANDALDEFLNLALDYEQRETPSLQGFVAWLRAAQSEVRRDMEMARDEVRVMTVHGAKGLEANTVILADTTTDAGRARIRRSCCSSQARRDGLGRPQAGRCRRDRRGARSAARARSGRRIPPPALRRDDARGRAARRLRRARARKIPDGCWYELVRDALAGECAAKPADDGGGDVLRYRKYAGDAVPNRGTPASLRLPAHFRLAAAQGCAGAPALRTLTPSDRTRDVRAAPRRPRQRALLRGSLTHRLMQVAAGHCARAPPTAARDYLARAGDALAARRAARASPRRRCTSREHPRFAALFGPDSRAEVPIVGRLTSGRARCASRGQIDRLVVARDAVLIADYKTDRPPPSRIEDCPDAMSASSRCIAPC